MFKSKIIHSASVGVLPMGLLLLVSVTTFGQGTAFTYQGRLTDNGNTANGSFDMQFKLFDSPDIGTGDQVGTTITNLALQVTNGVFAVPLDFGTCATCFDGSARFLEVSVRPAGSPDAFTVLSPRQEITSTPYAVRSATAASADTATQLGGLPAGGFIQNTNSQQAGTSFNIGGNGTLAGTLAAGVVNATTRYDMGGSRVLSVAGAGNVFVGIGAGESNTATGINNSFFGFNAGQANQTSDNNSFFGRSAGAANQTGFANSYFGANAGALSTANNNSFFGAFTGDSNTSGGTNSFFGFSAGRNNETGSVNSFFGVNAGDSNNTGNSNTIIGGSADVLTGDLANATAIGARARVDQSNSLVLGAITGINNGISVNVGIGTTAPSERLHVVGNGLFTGNVTVTGTLNATLPAGSASYIQNTTSQQAGTSFNISGNGTAGGTLSADTVNATTRYDINGSRVLSVAGTFNLFAGVNAGVNTTGNSNSFFGRSAGQFGEEGNRNSFFGRAAGQSNRGSDNSFFGESAGFSNTNGSNNTLIGSGANVADSLDNATAIGASAQVDRSNSLVLGSITGINGGTSVNVGIGLTAPKTRLDVVSAESQIRFGDTANDEGGYLLSTVSSQAVLAGGARWNSSDFVARSSSSSAINMFSGIIRFFNDTGLTVGSTFSPTEVMRINASGSVGIGTISPADKLQVAGDIRIGTGITGCVRDADATVIAGACSSDAKLKTAITPFPNLLDKLVRLRPVHFYWRADEYKDRAFGRAESFGLIAQEVEEVLPELVSEDDQGLKVVRYNKLPLLMLQAIKELKAENDSLKLKLDEIHHQQDQIKQQQIQIENLKKIICLNHPHTEGCK